MSDPKPINPSQRIARIVLNEKGIADALGVSASFVRKDRSGKRLLPFFRIGDLIRYDLERVQEALLANEEGGPQKATRKRTTIASVTVLPAAQVRTAAP